MNEEILKTAGNGENQVINENSAPLQGWAQNAPVEAKTALAKAKSELAQELQSPFAVCNALRKIAKDKTSAIAQVLAALDIKPRELSPRDFGRFCLQTPSGLAIGREVSEAQLLRLRNPQVVEGFRADGTPTKYVVCELKPNAYISALYALARDKGIKFDRSGKVLEKAPEAGKTEKGK